MDQLPGGILGMFLAKLKDVRRAPRGDGWWAKCPIHNIDALYWENPEEGIRHSCEGGCTEEQVRDMIWPSAASVYTKREEGEEITFAGDPAPAPVKTRLGLLPASALLDKEIPPTEWLLQPYIEKGALFSIVAPPNLGKTLLALWMATHLARGGFKTAFIEEEGGERGFQKRLSRAIRHAHLTKEQADLICYSFKPRVSLIDPADVTAIADECVGFDMVFIDSLARVMPGVEENSSKEMGQVVASLDLIRTHTGAAVGAIHHTAKAKWRAGEVPHLGDSRGSSALEAGMDTMIALAPLPEVSQVEGCVTFDLHITKQRDEGKAIASRFTILMTGPEAVVEVLVDPNGSSLERKIADRRSSILTHTPTLEAEARLKGDVCRMVGGRKADVVHEIDLMIMEGLIRTSAGRLYRPTGEV